jgi:FkbM family methyltransferase
VNRPEKELLLGFEFIVAHLMLTKPNPFFIQIGANDGVSNDPLHKFVKRFNLEGILLEPLPEVFGLLERNYAGQPNLKLINAALSETDGQRTIYSISMDSSTFQKAHQFTSFRKEQVLSQTEWVPDVSSRIVERQVRAMSFASLLKEVNGRTVDILQIDTEGYDANIIRMIDFNELRPQAICYEHVHMSKTEQEEIVTLLSAQGYQLSRDNLDTVAYRPTHTFGFR